MTCSRLGQCNLISSSPTLCSTAVAIICRLSHIPRLSASDTGTLHSTIRIALPSPYPSRAAAACHTAGTLSLDDMADTSCCLLYASNASRPAQATTMKVTRKTEQERQRQPRKVLHMPTSVNIPERCKNIKHKTLRIRPLGQPPLTPPPLATPLACCGY